MSSDAAGLTSPAPAGVPDFAIKYAPLLYLYSKDPYRPSDIRAQLVHTKPRHNLDPLPAASIPSPLTLDNLDQLNALGNGGADIFLTSNDDVSKNPAWLCGVTPDSNGKVHNAKTCVIIVAEKDNGVIDVFYVYFYAYNWGGKVLGDNLGNHVGDWEHNMVRFVNGVPKYVWYSQHASGQAFKYEAVKKDKSGFRPISFSATGSHANYAIDGTHDHTIPTLHEKTAGILNDFTDYGPLYDPTLSAYWYKWSPAKNTSGATAGNSGSGHQLDNIAKRGIFTPYDKDTPVKYLYFEGCWGDERYPEKDPRQRELFDSFFRYENGPTGPADKNIGRKDVWIGSEVKIFDKLGP